LVENHKVDPRPLDEDLRPNETKLKWYLHGTILEGNSIGSDQKYGALKKAPWFGEPRCKLGSKVVSSIVFHCFTIFIVFKKFKIFFRLVVEVEIVQEWKTFHV
jgi:hypothetical protein